MGQTVSNQNKSIVHAGSGHVAQTSADICTLPVPAAYDNKVSSSNLAAGKAAKTTIGGHAVGMEGSHWDPSTSVGKVGVGSGTTQAHAWVASGSSDDERLKG